MIAFICGVSVGAALLYVLRPLTDFYREERGWR